MTLSKTTQAVKLALLPLACVSLLAACAYYDPYGNPVATSAPVVIDNPDVVFDRLDTNRDGFLSRGELDVLVGTAPAGPIETPDVVFRRLDVNRDGFLSRQEAAAAISTIPGATFDQMDVNRDGFLSMAEAEPHLRWYASRSPLYSWFDALDANRDGFLTRAEAAPLMRSTRFAAGRWEVSPWPPVGVSYPPYSGGAVYGPR